MLNRYMNSEKSGKSEKLTQKRQGSNQYQTLPLSFTYSVSSHDFSCQIDPRDHQKQAEGDTSPISAILQFDIVAYSKVPVNYLFLIQILFAATILSFASFALKFWRSLFPEREHAFLEIIRAEERRRCEALKRERVVEAR